jgi:hypothetical protein
VPFDATPADAVEVGFSVTRIDRMYRAGRTKACAEVDLEIHGLHIVLRILLQRHEGVWSTALPKIYVARDRRGENLAAVGLPTELLDAVCQEVLLTWLGPRYGGKAA